MKQKKLIERLDNSSDFTRFLDSINGRNPIVLGFEGFIDKIIYQARLFDLSDGLVEEFLGRVFYPSSTDEYLNFFIKKDKSTNLAYIGDFVFQWRNHLFESEKADIDFKDSKIILPYEMKKRTESGYWIPDGIKGVGFMHFRKSY